MCVRWQQTQHTHTNTHMHVQLNDMHVLMQAACDDTDMDTHAETHQASPVLTDMRYVAVLHALHSHVQYMELRYINSGCKHGEPLHFCIRATAQATTHTIQYSIRYDQKVCNLSILTLFDR